MNSITQKTALFLFISLISSVSSLHCMDDQELNKLLQNPSQNCLQGKKIALTVEVAPNYDVPLTGAGDCLFYSRVLSEKLQEMGADEVVVDLGKSYGWLKSFFEKCSDITVLSTMEEDEQKQLTSVEVRTVLDALPDLNEFKSKSRYLPKTCKWAHGEIKKIVEHIQSLQEDTKDATGKSILPVLFTRQSAEYPIKNKEEENLFGYLNHRSIAREKLAEILEDKPKHVSVYNIQFEDQKEDDIAGTEKPGVLYEGYSQRNGAFVNDALLMAAVIQAGGQVVSIDSSPLNLAIGIPRVDDSRKNIKALLAKEHNSRWKKPFLNKDGSVCWSDNVELLVQDNMDDWSTVGEKLMKLWNVNK